jgi:heptosyltransferase-2
MSKSLFGYVKKTRREKSEFSRILVLRLSSIGDIVLTMPLLKHLAQHFPSAIIDFVVKKEYADLMRSNPYINTLRVVDKKEGWPGLKRLKKEIKAQDYELILDVHNNPRTRYLTLFSKATVRRYKKYRLLRFFLINLKYNLYERIIPVHRRYLNTVAEWVHDVDSDLEFHLDPDAERGVTRFMQSKNFSAQQKHLALVPGAGFANKRWPVHYFAELAGKTSSEGWQIWLLGSPTERHLGKEIEKLGDSGAINLIGELSLMQSASVLARMNAIVTNDSGLMHIADALNVPVVAIFGPTTRELGFYPVSPNSRVVEHEQMPCRPCTHMGADSCPKDHFRCMLELTSDVITDKVSELKNIGHFYATTGTRSG